METILDHADVAYLSVEGHEMTNEKDDLSREDARGNFTDRLTAPTASEGSAHTPAPWKLEDMRDCASPHIAIRPEGSGFLLASLSPETFTYGAGRHNIEANARLIAAAPDLLAACKAALAMASGRLMCLPTETDRECLNRVQRKTSAALLAAIAKAEGRS